MTIRKALIVPVLFACLACPGCCTIAWNREIDSKLRVELSTKTFPAEPDSFALDDGGKYPRYKKCHYLGTETLPEGTKCHHYICPNMYNDSENAFLELHIPFDETGKNAAIITSVNRPVTSIQSRIHDPVYIYFTPEGAPPDRINPRDFVDHSLPAKRFTTQYPSLISLKFDQGSHKTWITVGQRMDPESYATIDLIRFSNTRKNYFSVCPDSGPMLKYNYFNLSTAANCDLWYWSDTIKASGTVKTKNKPLWKMARYVGYIVTVPADIITSPIQGIFLLMLSASFK